MTLWLTLLLVWTTGIPAALFVTAGLAAALNQRRAGRFPSLGTLRGLHGPATACGRRMHADGPRTQAGHRARRVRLDSRRPI
jgi:hypothetical protein